MSARQKKETERYSERCKEDKPSRTAQLNFVPVLYDDNCGDRDREQHGERSGFLQGNAERKQRDRNESLSEAERRPNQRGDEDDQEYQEGLGFYGSPPEIETSYLPFPAAQFKSS